MNMKTMKGFKLMMAIGILVWSISCSSESEDDITPTPPSEDRCEDNNATLSGDVSAIINTNCAVSGCHVAGTGRVDFTQNSNIIQNATQIRTYTESGFMPPPEANNTLSSSEKDAIFCWVADGAQNN